MTGIDYFAWFIFIVIVVASVAIFIVLAQMPGKTARKRGHPQADAINIASWLGLLLTLGVVWVLAMIWARMTPVTAADFSADIETLKARIDEIESRITTTGVRQ